MGEHDRLITLITRDMGVIRAYASGVKSIKSKRGAATGLLSYSNFLLEKKGENYRVCEASVIKVFFGAGSDIAILSLAQYFCEICYILGADINGGEEFLRLILNSLHFLTASDKNPVLIKAITELRVAAISGYMPDLVACGECGKFEDDIMYFKLNNGSLLCSDCKKGEYLVPLDKTLMSAMRHIVYSPFERLYSFDIPQEAAGRLSAVTEKYITFQTEHHFSALDFYNNLK